MGVTSAAAAAAVSEVAAVAAAATADAAGRLIGVEMGDRVATIRSIASEMSTVSQEGEEVELLSFSVGVTTFEVSRSLDIGKPG